MKSVSITRAQARLLNRKPLKGKAVYVAPRGAVYNTRGTAVSPISKGM